MQDGFFSRKLDAIINTDATRIFTMWVIMNCLFTAIYLALSYIPGQGPTIPTDQPLPLRAVNIMYFTLVTTFTIGYGDIVPQGVSKVLIMLQSLTAMILMVAFTTKLISRKQEEAIDAMHAFTDGNTVRHIREEFYLLRKDLERIMHAEKEHGSVSESNWELAEAAALHALVLVDDIKELLAEMGKSDTRTNRRREQVIFESMYRTVRRFDEFFSQLSHYDTSLSHAHVSFLHAAREFFEEVHGVARVWHTLSPHQRITEFDERIMATSTRMETHIDHVLHLTRTKHPATKHD